MKELLKALIEKIKALTSKGDSKGLKRIQPMIDYYQKDIDIMEEPKNE